MTTAFDYAALRDALGLYASRFDADHLAECSSTNSELAQRALASAPSGSVLICDVQSAGRGRRGRHWLSSPAHSLCFSLLWHFDSEQSLSGLSLAIGIAIARTLDRLGAAQVTLKWPNDIWLNRRKVGGVLVEASTVDGRCAAIIGIGLNLRWHEALADIDPPATALDQVINLPAREILLARLLIELARLLDEFAYGGFAALRDEWQAWHGLQGQAVRIIEDQNLLRGQCMGVDVDGALLLNTEAGLVRVRVGDVSLRARPCTS